MVSYWAYFSMFRFLPQTAPAKLWADSVAVENEPADMRELSKVLSTVNQLMTVDHT